MGDPSYGLVFVKNRCFYRISDEQFAEFSYICYFSGLKRIWHKKNWEPEQDRTADLLRTRQALSQLSYKFDAKLAFHMFHTLKKPTEAASPYVILVPFLVYSSSVYVLDIQAIFNGKSRYMENL